MRKGKNRSQVSLQSISKSAIEVPDVYVPPSDKLTVKIHSLRLMDEDPKRFTIKVTFLDQLIVTGIIKAVGMREVATKRTLLKGTMTYDPADYERMCMFADSPLTVHIQSLKSVESIVSRQTISPQTSIIVSHKSSSKSESITNAIDDISCCNVDIMPLFIDTNKMSVEKRLEPLLKPPLLHRKSWDNLPILAMEVLVSRNKDNEHHHEILKRANYMKITLLSSHNMLVPYDDDYIYTAASKIAMHNDTNSGLVTFNQGYRAPKRFNGMSCYPKWESLRIGDEVFTKGDEKFVSNLEDLQNEKNINLKHYLSKTPYSVVWASFHRTLMLENSDRWLWKHLQQFNWPFELHIYGEKGGYSFMAFLDLFKLLYPGEHTLRLAVPLQWINSEAMMSKCGCEPLLTPNEKAPSISAATTQKPSKANTESTPLSGIDVEMLRPTGADDNCAFVILEIKLRRPLKKIVIPPHIHSPEINEMLKGIEQQGPIKRECSGRGQLDRDWQSTVRNAASSLRKVPYYGMTEFCIFNRQLSETRTRVELSTSFWQDAAVYVNNNFVVQDFLRADTFEEMLMMAHACLMRKACETLVGVENRLAMDPVLQAARHARQMQDITHAMDLYLQVVVQKPRDGNCWRELAVCLMDVDRDWASVCINNSIVLNPRHPLSLLVKGSMLHEEDPAAAEPFFVALLALYPFWSTAWVATSAYYTERELFQMADQIIKYNKKTHAEGLSEDIGFSRSWERELGDWWDNTPILPGMNKYYDAADLLLRLRAVTLAEACVSRALLEEGESAAYFHLVSLCCRLRGNVPGALCHLRAGIEKYGEISYLRSLEAECYHKLNNITAASMSFEKAGCCIGAYSILLSTPIRDPQRSRTVLVDLVRRQPCSYTWMALAHDWMTRASTGEGGDAGVTEEQVAVKTCATACAVQALKWDRGAGKAWALLSSLVKPSARRLFCKNMASACGYTVSEHRMDCDSESKQSLCHRLGTALRECRCKLCDNIRV